MSHTDHESLLVHGADKSIRNASGNTAYKSVFGNFDDVKDIYDYFSKVYAPLGLGKSASPRLHAFHKRTI